MEEVSPENLNRIESRYRATALIISGQIVFTLVLTVAVWLFATKTESSISRQTVTTLWVSIIFLALGAFVMRRMFFRWDRLKDITVLKGISGLLRTLQINAVILAAFATLSAIIGCIITVLTGETFEMLRALIVALIVFFINFPRKAVWEKIVAGMEKV